MDGRLFDSRNTDSRAFIALKRTPDGSWTIITDFETQLEDTSHLEELYNYLSGFTAVPYANQFSLRTDRDDIFLIKEAVCTGRF